MGKIKHEKAIARLIAQIKASPEPQRGIMDYLDLAIAGLEVAALAMEATREHLCPMEEAAVILGNAMAAAAVRGPLRCHYWIERPARALSKAGHNCKLDKDQNNLKPDCAFRVLH